MLGTCAVTFWAEKEGNTVAEYEDAARACEGHPAAGLAARFVVVDGATEAYDAVRWVAQLVRSFVPREHRNGLPAPALNHAAMGDWFVTMQQRWLDEAPTHFAHPAEEITFREVGSFATLVGCELDLVGPTPRWRAVALGDSVLFHVRGARCTTWFPHLSAADFGLSPDGVHTRSEALSQMQETLRFDAGDLRAGDLLYLATDAMAQWIIERMDVGDAALWPTLARFLHPATFRAFVTDRRASGELRNDDTTLLRVQVLDAEPRFLAVCL